MTEIYRIKIRQLQLPSRSASFDYFPFDNIYLVPKDKANDVIPKLFKYCLVMDLNAPLITAIRNIQLRKSRDITIHRNDKAFEWKSFTDPEAMKLSTEFLTQGEWVGIVPTYAITSPRSENKTRQLQYVISYAIKSIHNRFAVLPKIMLHTPKRTLPALCAICKHVAEYYQNTCAPASYKCKSNIFLNDLDNDNSNDAAVATSIAQAGAVE